MDEDDEFGDLYSDVFQPPPILPPPPPSFRSIDLNLPSNDQDVTEEPKSNSSSVSHDDEKEMNFDIDEPDADDSTTPTIPGLFVNDSIPGLTIDRDDIPQGDDWDSDSEDDLQIVLNDSNRNIGADRRTRIGNNDDDDDDEDDDDDDDDDDEEPLVIVADGDTNQPMEDHQLWGGEGEEVDGEGKEGEEGGKGSVGGQTKSGYNSYHPFHSQFKYVRPGASPITTGGTSSGQVRPPANVGPMAGRGRGDWRPMGVRNASAAQKGLHQQPWGGNTAGRGMDFTLPSHKTIFEVDIESFEEKPWRYPGVDITDYFSFGLNEESWKDYCKQLDQRRIETTMQSRIRVYESGRTDQGYDPDLPPELVAATGTQSVPVNSSVLVKLDTEQGDSANVPAHVRPPPLPPGRPIPVETGSGERLSSIDTRAPRMCDLDTIIEIVCHDSHEDEPLGEQADSSLPGETGYVKSKASAENSPKQDELLKKEDDEISRSTDSSQSFRSSSPVRDRRARSSSIDREDVGGESGKDGDMEEEHKTSSVVPQSVVQEDDGGESKTERSKARAGSQRDYQQMKGTEENIVQDKHYPRPSSNRKQYDNNAPQQSRKNQDRGKEMERTRNPHMESDFDKRNDPYNRRGVDEGFRKRDREDDSGSRQRGKMRESEIRSNNDHGHLRKHMEDDHNSKRRKDEEYLRRNRSEKNETSYGQRESTSRHQKRDIQQKTRDDFDDYGFRNERFDKLEQTQVDGLSGRGRERQVRAHRGSEDRSSRIKDENKEHITKDASRHTKQTKRREHAGEESSHHRVHEHSSAHTNDIVNNNEKKPRQERTSGKSDKVVDTLDGQRLQERKHRDSRRKTKEQRDGTESLRSKQGEQNGISEVTGLKGTNESRNSKSEILQQSNATKRRKENASSDDELQDSKRGRSKLERWSSHKERDDAVPASVSSKPQEKEKSINGRLSEPVHGSTDKNLGVVTEEKSGHDLAETKTGNEKGSGDIHLDTVEKLKKRSERFKLPMPTEKDSGGVKKIESETLPSVKIEAPADSEVKAERPARKRRWTSS